MIDDDDDVCSICLSSVSSEASVTSCDHVFHAQCINLWVEREDQQNCDTDEKNSILWSCPICRRIQIMARPWLHAIDDEENGSKQHPLVVLDANAETSPLLGGYQLAELQNPVLSKSKVGDWFLLAALVVILVPYIAACTAVYRLVQRASPGARAYS